MTSLSALPIVTPGAGDLLYLEQAGAGRRTTPQRLQVAQGGLLQAVSATVTAQPASPVDGDVYILPAGKTGAAWGPMANGALAYWRDGAWEAITPREGWLAWVRDTDQLLAFDGAGWTGVPRLAAPNTFSAPGNVFTHPITIGPLAVGNNITGPNSGFAYSINTQPDFLGAGITMFGSAHPNAGLLQLRTRTTDNVVLVNGATLFHSGVSAVPNVDNARALGAASFRFSQLFAASGTINTSDAREKTALAPIDAALKAAAGRIRASIGVFQWLQALERKGGSGARLHIGVTAQAVRDAFLAEGLDPGRYGLFCEDPLFERVEVAPERIETDPETGEAFILPAVTEERPVLDASGAPVTRLGVRADQLAFLLLAAG